MKQTVTRWVSDPMDMERFAKFIVAAPNGCWIWCGSHQTSGYGRFYLNGKITGAHRAAYEIAYGPIPVGLTIDHLCRQIKCVNPAHLEAVTMRENVLRGDTFVARQAAQTHCWRGHDLAAAYVAKSRKRSCLECRRIRRANGAA